eukprot:4454417-Lingulodinium_polyedra.AAC.1
MGVATDDDPPRGKLHVGALDKNSNLGVGGEIDGDEASLPVARRMAGPRNDSAAWHEFLAPPNLPGSRRENGGSALQPLIRPRPGQGADDLR